MPIGIHESFAAIPAPDCLDSGTCVADTIFERSTIPYEMLIGKYIYVMFWGLALFLIQLKSHTPMLTGMVGLIIAILFIGTSTYTGAGTAEWFYYGYILCGIAIGTVMYTLLKSRVIAP